MDSEQPAQQNTDKSNGNGRRGNGQGERLKQAARDTGQSLREGAEARVEQGQSEAASMAADSEEALESAAQSFAEHGQESLAQSATAVAAKLGALSHKLETENLDGLTREARRLAQENPGLFIAGGVALGLVLGRFFSASSPQPDATERAAMPDPFEQDEQEEWGDEGYPGEAAGGSSLHSETTQGGSYGRTS